MYAAVLHRALNPMAEALSEHLENASGLKDYTDLPAIMTDLLLLHPRMAALFQQTINLLAMYNLTTGYFLSQRVLDSPGGGKLQDPENIARQKQLLHKVIRAMLIS